MMVICCFEVQLFCIICLLYLCILLYIVLCGDGIYMLGVIMLEFGVKICVMVWVVVELFFLVYVLYLVFVEVEIFEFGVDVCFVFFDNLLCLCCWGNMFYVNGFYCYGYFLVFVVVWMVVDYIIFGIRLEFMDEDYF